MSRIRELIEQFDGNPMNVRLEITREILQFGDEAVPELIKGLEHATWSVRQDCANALAELADPRATVALIRLLGDRETGVRYEAARALGRIGSDDAKAALNALVQHVDDEQFRYFLYDCLHGNA